MASERHRSLRKSLGCCVAVLLVTTLWAASGSQAVSFQREHGAVTRHYAGSVKGQPSATVDLAAVFRHGRLRRVEFEALAVPAECEESVTIDFPTITAKARSERLFEDRYVVFPNQLFKVQGNFSGGGRARGFLFYFDGDCSTDGLLRWRADRIAG